MKKNISLFICLLFTILPVFVIKSQEKIDKAKRKEFYDIYKKENVQTDYSKNAGDKLLIHAQDDYERALSYIVKAETKYSDCDYINAVEFAETSKKYANKTDSTLIKTRILHSLIISYRRAGLISESEESWKEFKKAVKKIPVQYQEINILYTQSKIYDIDENYCEAFKTKEKFLKIEQAIEPNSPYRQHYDFSILSQIAYCQIKCGNFERARKTMVEIDQVFKEIKPTKPILLQEFMYLNKALLYNFNKEKDNAKKYFDSAYTLANKRTNKVVLKLILKERIDANVDNTTDLLLYSKIVQKISESETTATKKLTLTETQKNKDRIFNKEKKINIYIAIFIAFLIVTLIILYLQKKKNLCLKEKYHQILAQIETEDQKNDENREISSSNEAEIQNTDIIKNLDTETKIIKSLELFENKHHFTTKDISLAKMAVMLKTNTKYLNFVLKKHRNTDFYKYIHTYRINYIVKELHNKPQLLQYKISVIAEMCGYNSHSQFAIIFKTQKGMSPSQYIEFLAKDKSLS